MSDFSNGEGASVDPRHSGRGSNQSELRAHNERLILSILRSSGPTAKAEIARLTGLSAQSASVIMRKLEREVLIERGSPVRGKVGQPSVPMRLSAQGALFFGLKIGRRSADMVLVDFLGNILDRMPQSYKFPEPDSILDFVRGSFEQITSRLTTKQRDRISGLGIAIPGHLWEWAEIIGEPADKMAAWRERDIRAEIEELFDFPVLLQNDASCACGAELVFGRQDYPPEFIYFFVGYFVGGGVVLNHTLFTGPTGNAGAFGPLPVPGSAGDETRLIDVASLSLIEKAMQAAGCDAAALWDRSDMWEVPNAILDQWLERAAEGLAYAIVASCSVIDFQLAVIDGWFPQQIRHDLVELTKNKLGEYDLTGLSDPEIREGTIGPEARSLGAASLPLAQRFIVS